MEEKVSVNRPMVIIGLVAILVVIGSLELATGIFFGYIYSQMPLASVLQQGLLIMGVGDVLPLVAGIIVVVAIIFFASAYGIYRRTNWGPAVGIVATILGVFVAGFVSSFSNFVNQATNYFYTAFGGLLSTMFLLDSLQGPAIYVNIVTFLGIIILHKTLEQREVPVAS